MTLNSLLIAGCIALSLTACQDTITHKQNVELVKASNTAIESLANMLQIQYEQVDNRPSEYCDKTIENGNCFEAKLHIKASGAVNVDGWKIYFSQITPIQQALSDEFTITHVNGDLHVIELKEAFKGFKAGETKTITFYANFWSLSHSDAIPNYILVNHNEYAKVITSTKPTVDPETGLELLPHVVPYSDYERQFKRTKNDETQWLTAERLFERNTKYDFSPYLKDENKQVAQHIIPTPTQATFSQTQQLDISQGLRFNLNGVSEKGVTAAIERLKLLGITTSASGIAVNLNLSPTKDGSQGSYRLAINANEININATDDSGVFYALQSLASLYQVNNTTLPIGQVNDAPHYEFRGVLVDVARNFRDKAFILKLLDQMAAYKLNKLHLHLADDEGWRLEIPSLEELTDVASKRCFDLSEQQCLMPQLGAGIDTSSQVNGFYSVDDYQEILKFASARHIQVIPSLDMPGHSRAAIKAMQARYNKYIKQGDKQKAEQFLLYDPLDTTVYSSVQHYNDNTINVCLDSSYEFIREVMEQVKIIHNEAQHPLTRYHIGADETAGAWVSSPACTEFIKQNNLPFTKAEQLGSYFIERVSNMLADMNIETAAWSDGLSHTNPNNMPDIVQGNSWDLLMWNGHQRAHQFTNRNWQVVVSSPDVLYFDFPYEADPQEHGYYWASRHINTEKVFQFMPDNLPAHAEFWLDREDRPYTADDTIIKNDAGEVEFAPLAKGKQFIGIQGQLWSENTRTNNMAEYKLFPRLLSLAQRAWHKAQWAVPYDHNGFVYSRNTQRFTPSLKQQRDQQWLTFAASLGLKEFNKLERANVHFRIANAGAKIENGMLYANVAYPGLLIEYMQAGGQWQTYNAPVKVTQDVWVRSKLPISGRVSRTLKVTQP